MPIYEYRRPDGSTFEIVQSFSDDPLTHDPDTGAPVERVLHAPAVHFKGTGFYNTDYGTRKRQRETAASSAEESSAKKDSDKGSDGGASSDPKGKGGKASDGAKPKQDAAPVAATS
jgi:putative FmdB family regulatory protein